MANNLFRKILCTHPVTLMTAHATTPYALQRRTSVSNHTILPSYNTTNPWPLRCRD